MIKGQKCTSPDGRLSLRDPALGVLSSALLFFSFPKLNFFPLAWFGLVPLIFASRRKNAFRAFLLGWFSGTVFFLPLLFWLMPVFRPMGLLGFLPWFLIAIFQGAYWGLWTLSMAWVEKMWGGRSYSWARVIFPAVSWVTLEWLRSLGPLGFLWGGLGYSQYKLLPLIQISSLTGFYGVSFLIVMINASLVLLIENSSEGRGMRIPTAVAGSLVLSAAVVCFGFLRLSWPMEVRQSRPFRAAVVQVNIDQDVKWDRSYFEQTMGLLEEMTLSAARSHPDLIIWPETAVPSYLLSDSYLLSRVKSLASDAGAALLTGTLEAENGRNYNSVVLLPLLGPAAVYRKIHLVPFAEYLPFERRLRRFSVFDRIGSFSSGSVPAVFRLDGLELAPLICFESIFPQPARKCTLKGASIVAVLTNDAWFLRTSAAEHHLAMSVFRAVENGINLIQAANTGISAFVDPCGRITSKSPLFERTVLQCEIQLLGKPFFSLYPLTGDLFPLLCAILLLLFLFRAYRRETDDAGAR